MKDSENRNIKKREVTLYEIQGKKAKYEFLIEKAKDGTYRAYLPRMWGDADTSSVRKGTRYTNDGDEHNYYVTQSPAPRSEQEALEAAWRWVTEYDRQTSAYNSNTRTEPAVQWPWHHIRGGERKPQVMRMTQEVLEQIEASIGSKRAETGGALGGNREEFLVEHFYFDRSSTRSGVTYSPDDQELNRIFRDDWNPRDIYLLGFVHSHPAGIWRPSPGDLFYAKRILAAIPDLEYLLLPIVQSRADTGHFDIHPYAAVRGWYDVEIVKLRLEVVRTKRSYPGSSIDAGGFTSPRVVVPATSDKPSTNGKKSAKPAEPIDGMDSNADDEVPIDGKPANDLPA